MISTQKIQKIPHAFAHLAVIKQATSDEDTLMLCNTASDLIAEDGIVINDDVDPAADLQMVSLQPFFDAIDECNRIADSSSNDTIKADCKLIADSLIAIIHKLI